MEKKSFDIIKKTIYFLFAVFFLVSVTATVVSAEEVTGSATDTSLHDSGTNTPDNTVTGAGTASSAAATSVDSSNY